MLLTVTSAGWRLQGSEEEFEQTSALTPQSHLQLNWFAGTSGQTLTEVWVSLHLTEHEPIQKLMIHWMEGRDLEWRFGFEGDYDPLTLVLSWNRIHEASGEITLINRGVSRNLLDEMGASERRESTVSFDG